jgi:hypothetical protein
MAQDTAIQYASSVATLHAVKEPFQMCHAHAFNYSALLFYTAPLLSLYIAEDLKTTLTYSMLDFDVKDTKYR